MINASITGTLMFDSSVSDKGTITGKVATDQHGVQKLTKQGIPYVEQTLWADQSKVLTTVQAAPKQQQQQAAPAGRSATQPAQNSGEGANFGDDLPF